MMELKDRFNTLWRKIGTIGIPSYDKLVFEYNKREYHNLCHISDCFSGLDEVSHIAEDIYALEVAIWYHDYKYDIFSTDNEERSAQSVCDICKCLNLPEKFISKVGNIVLATKLDRTATNLDEMIMKDIDVLIFGKSFDKFVKYEDAIRKEYSVVDNKTYCNARIKIIDKFLEQGIYLTEFFKNKYETKAYTNLTWAKESLKANF